MRTDILRTPPRRRNSAEVKISEHHVNGHSCTAFPVNPAPQHSPLRTLSSPEPLFYCTLLGAKRHREDGHTDRNEEIDSGRGKTRLGTVCSASTRHTQFVGMAVKRTDDNEPLSTGVTCTTQRVLDGGSALKLPSSQKVPSPLPNLLLVGPFLPMLPMLATALQRLGDVLQSWTADRQSDTRPCIPLMMSSSLPEPSPDNPPNFPSGPHPEVSETNQHPKTSTGMCFFWMQKTTGFRFGTQKSFWRDTKGFFRNTSNR